MSSSATQVGTTVTFEDHGTTAARPGESLLLTGLRAGVPLAYECASGGCGTCRAQLVDGSVTSSWTEATGLSERDRRRGDRVLLCQSMPDGPCTVRPIGLSDHGGEPTPSRCVATIAERHMLTADTASFVLTLEGPLDYLPGQFVVVEFADRTRRAYSMSRPADTQRQGEIELLVRAKPGGKASAWLFDGSPVGMTVVVEGPYGRAYARSGDGGPVLCLAGGTGLAPILAIAGHFVDAHPGRPIEVYVGARAAHDLVHADRLNSLRERGAKVVVATEVEPATPHATLGEIRRGYALDHLADEWPDLARVDVYLAGPAPMVDASVRRLVREGTLSADRLYVDRFGS